MALDKSKKWFERLIAKYEPTEQCKFGVGDLVRMAGPGESFHGRILTIGHIAYEVSFDMTYGPDKVVWMKPEHIILTKRASHDD